MVEYALNLDGIFNSLADATRRDILKRLTKKHLNVSEIASVYDLTYAAISKHLKVLEKAKLIIKKRRGKEQVVELSPPALAKADEYLERYRELWEERFNRLDILLQEDLKKK